MGTDYYAVYMYGKLFNAKYEDERNELEDKYYVNGFDVVDIGFDTHDEGTIVGRVINRADCGEFEEIGNLSANGKKEVDTAVGKGCKYYIIQEIN